MPCIRLGGGGIVCVSAVYKPGDLPPEGYLAWQEWAEVQRNAGIKLVVCPTCGLYRTPQELSTREIRWTVYDRRKQPHARSAFECAKCAEKRPDGGS